VATKQRAVERGRQRAADLRRSLGLELRTARLSHGLSCRDVGRAAQVSASEVSRIERALVKEVSVERLSDLCAVLGMELAAKAYPVNTDALRDAGQARVLKRLWSVIAPSIVWRTEVPLPLPGDRRAWDATMTAANRSWQYGVEAESHPTDGQSVKRRVTLKQRDGGMDGVILLLPDTRQTRAFLREYGTLLRSDFPIPGATALRRLAAGEDPQGSAVVVL
jgi:transcriptional regulator with XRE-family HTH domain